MIPFSKLRKDPIFVLGGMIVLLTLLIGAGFLFLYYKSELDVKQVGNEVGIIRSLLTKKAQLEGMKNGDRQAAQNAEEPWDVSAAEQLRVLEELKTTLASDVRRLGYVMTVETWGDTLRVKISSQPGELFTSSGGPGGPGTGQFTDGFTFYISLFSPAWYEQEGNGYPETDTVYPNVKSVPACEAACWGGSYVAKKNGQIYFITYDENNVAEQEIEDMLGIVFAAFR